MKTIELTRRLFDADITVLALPLDRGIQLSVYGGSLPHIGSVSVVGPAQESYTMRSPGHKDDVISERWAKALSKAGFCPVVVGVGIHYDHLSREGIEEVVMLTDEMLRELLDSIAGEC